MEELYKKSINLDELHPNLGFSEVLQALSSLHEELGNPELIEQIETNQTEQA
jgi:hypothetical protein